MFVLNLQLKMMSSTEYVLGSALKTRKTVENLIDKVPVLTNFTQLHKEAMNSILENKEVVIDVMTKLA